MNQNEGLTLSSEKLILIVDDDETMLDALEERVKIEGFRTDRASDGLEALRKVAAPMPDLILLDLMMPLPGGLEVLRRLQEGKTARIPIIIITGRFSARTTQEMIRQEPNVVDFMEKPLNSRSLGLTLHRILKTKPPEMGRQARGT